MVRKIYFVEPLPIYLFICNVVKDKISKVRNMAGSWTEMELIIYHFEDIYFSVAHLLLLCLFPFVF
jgi:hypothetical protein